FKEGYSIIKLKIGALDFDEECRLIESLRKEKNAFDLEIRVDANGGFSYPAVNLKLDQLSQYHIHSIEQPIATGKWKSMERLCRNSPIPIALDEELIYIRSSSKRRELLKIIQPQYIILKPSLLGGFEDSDDWIQLAEKENVKWWATSALESNIGLNAIAQWASTKATILPQGLGTGLLFSNNIDSPLELRGENLFYTSKAWEKL
ncbi:MAG: enolase C-terminal domain-like protein, partial [Flavobacteriales bacterium]